MIADSEDGRPNGELTMRVQALPADANADGHVFGGWVVAQMDLAAAIHANERVGGRVATVAINSLVFRKPVKIGDVLSVFTRIEKVGRTSVTVLVEAWAQRHLTRSLAKVTEGTLVMVALDSEGRPVEIPKGHAGKAEAPY